MTEFIPMMPGQQYLLQEQSLISNLLGQIGYEVSGNKVIFSEDITIDSISAVNMKLLVSDISKLSDYDVLPIPASMESDIIEQVYAQFAPVQSSSDKVSNYSTENEK